MCGGNGEPVRVLHSHVYLGAHHVNLVTPIGVENARGVMKIAEDAEARKKSLSGEKRWHLTPDGWAEERKSE
jgi:hypothetical protein